jgi:RNAse (barnase) inhibitor barstar
MQEAGIAMLNIIDKKGVLAKALDMLWDTLTAEEKTATVEIALRSNTRQERDDDAETGEDTAQPNT